MMLYTNIFSLLKEILILFIVKGKIERIAKNSYQLIKNYHTVENRVETLINLVESFNSQNSNSQNS